MISNTISNAVTMSGGDGALLANRYRIVKQLGQGGMGSVWLAEDTQLDNKPFAIKTLPSILVSNRRAYNQLKSEALVAMKLVHPNIVQIRAFEENDGNPFLVMDYIDGQTIDDYLADCSIRVEHVERVEVAGGRARTPGAPQPGGLPEDEVIRILKPIAAALDYAHGEGVVHRDVKPANVMIRKDGHPFILDFGISREMQETMTRVTGKLSSGTLLYMSPEQLNGDAPKPSQDIYSFAAMTYECLKGEPPFSRGNIEFQIMNKKPEPLPNSSPETGEVAVGRRGMTLVAGIMAGLSKNPKARPLTCLALIDGGCDRAKGNDGSTNQCKQAPLGGRMEPSDWNVSVKNYASVISSRLLGYITLLVLLLLLLGIFFSFCAGADRNRNMTDEYGMVAILCCLIGLCGVCVRRKVIEKRLESCLDLFAKRNWMAGRQSVEKAFEKDPYVQYFLGICLMYGFGGCKKDIASARVCFCNSAQAGVPEALCALGYLNQHGIGGDIDFMQANAYYCEAKNLGCELAGPLMRSVAQ